MAGNVQPEVIRYWSTEDEIRFLELIGTNAARNKLTPEELYERYLQSCKSRAVWDDIDKDRVVKKARQLHRRSVYAPSQDKSKVDSRKIQ